MKIDGNYDAIKKQLVRYLAETVFKPYFCNRKLFFPRST